MERREGGFQLQNDNKCIVQTRFKNYIFYAKKAHKRQTSQTSSAEGFQGIYLDSFLSEIEGSKIEKGCFKR
jgi:hypothetical protein